MDNSGIDPVAKALEGLDEIASGQSQPLQDLKIERQRFQQRLAKILDNLPELPDEEIIKLSPAHPVSAAEAASDARQAAAVASEAAAKAEAAARVEQEQHSVPVSAEPAH